MPPVAWLALAVIAAAGAYLLGWPAWQARRDRQARDTNTERYLAWRGRARTGPQPSEGPTGDQRRRVLAAGALGLLAIAALVGFFATS